MKGKLEKMGPLAADHPMVGANCQACHVPFEAGQYVALVPLGPGADPKARARALTNRPYTAVAIPVHWPCATGEER